MKKENSMTYPKDIIAFLKGKKSYLIGALEIILGLLTDNKEMILLGLSTITLRAGISGMKK